MATMVAVHGNTYPVKDRIRELGGRWDSIRKVWMVPVENHQEVMALVASRGVDSGRMAIRFDAIRDLIAHAKSHLKFPKVRLETEGGVAVVLSLAGERSKYCGSISVTTGEPYGTPGSYHGRIDADGTTTVRDREVLDLLRKLADDPAKVAAEYGRSTGNCCFCGRPLSNGEAGSASVGYGPVCAERWGLEWNPNGSEWELAEGHAVAV